MRPVPRLAGSGFRLRIATRSRQDSVLYALLGERRNGGALHLLQPYEFERHTLSNPRRRARRQGSSHRRRVHLKEVFA